MTKDFLRADGGDLRLNTAVPSTWDQCAHLPSTEVNRWW